MPVVERSPAWVAELVDDGLRAEVVFYEELDCLKLVFPRVHADLQISRIWVGFSSASPRQVQDFDTYKLFICVQDPNSDRPVAVRTPSLLSPSDVLFILDNPDLFLVGTDITGTVSDSYYATEPRTIVVDHPSSKRRLDLSRLDEKGRLTITMPKYTVVARDDLSDVPLQGHNGPKTR